MDRSKGLWEQLKDLKPGPPITLENFEEHMEKSFGKVYTKDGDRWKMMPTPKGLAPEHNLWLQFAPPERLQAYLERESKLLQDGSVSLPPEIIL